MSKNNYNNLYIIEQVMAVSSILLGKPDYLYRKMCRYISKNYNIPLDEVFEKPLVFVLQNYYESIYENINHNDLFDIAIQDIATGIIEKEEKDIEDWVKQIEEEIKQKENPPPDKPILPSPKEMSMSFSDNDFEDDIKYLSKNEFDLE